MSRRFKTTVQLDSGLIIPASAGAGKVLTSDGSGNAAWAAQASVPIEAIRYVGTAGQPAFTNSWVNYDTGTPGTPPMRAAGFWKDPEGIVRLCGVVKTGANNTSIFTLPVGYRPAVDRLFTIGASSNAPATLTVGANGTVTAINSASSAVSTYTLLDGVAIDTGQSTWPTGPQGTQGGTYGPPLVSALPGSPSDGQEVYFQDAAMATAGVAWHLRYRSGASGSYKWEFVGGPEFRNEVSPVTDESTASTTYAALTTAGPIITVPLSGDYVVAYGALIYGNNTTIRVGRMAWDNSNLPTANDTDAVVQAVSSVAYGQVSREQRKDSMVAASVLTMKYKVSSANATFFCFRYLSLRPVRVG